MHCVSRLDLWHPFSHLEAYRIALVVSKKKLSIEKKKRTSRNCSFLFLLLPWSMIPFYYWINQLCTACPVECRVEMLTRQLVWKGQLGLNRTGGDIETSPRFGLTVEPHPVCGDLNERPPLYLCGGYWGAQLFASWRIGMGRWGWEETMGGRIQSKTRNAYFPTYSPIPSGPIARKNSPITMMFVAYGGKGTPLYVCSHS